MGSGQVVFYNSSNRKHNDYTPNNLTPHFQHMGGSGSLFWYVGFGTGNTLW